MALPSSIILIFLLVVFLTTLYRMFPDFSSDIVSLMPKFSFNRVYYYQEGNLVHPRLNVSTAMRKALTTWASWVDKRINPRKTQVFFRSSAPSHFRFASLSICNNCASFQNPKFLE